MIAVKLLGYRSVSHLQDDCHLAFNYFLSEIANISHIPLLYNIGMTTPALRLTPAKIAEYRGAAKRRQEMRAPKVKIRIKNGWDLARKAAQVLREQYHVKRVVVFGSLLHENCFTEWSDIDIAAWGISSEQTFRAMGRVMDLDSTFEINLVDVNACPPELLKTIEKEGVDL